MSEKSNYNAPVLEITYFGVENIMPASVGGGGIELPDHEWD